MRTSALNEFDNNCWGDILCSERLDIERSRGPPSAGCERGDRDKGETIMAKPKAEKRRIQAEEVLPQLETVDPQNWLNEMLESNTMQLEMAANAFQTWNGHLSRAMGDAFEQWHKNYATWLNSVQVGQEMVTTAWQESIKQVEGMYRSWK